MTYNLTSRRKIGDYTQQINTTYTNSNKTSANTLTFLKQIHEDINLCNHYNTSVITYRNFSEIPSEKRDNIGDHFSITFTIKNKKTNEPKYYQISKNETPLISIPISDYITQWVNDLTGNNVTDSDYYLTLVNIII